MKYLIFFIFFFFLGLIAKDYESSQRLKDGDVISAEVFNDILDKIELTLKSATASELVGSWDAVQTKCAIGGSNCAERDVFLTGIGLVVSGYGPEVDNLFQQRLDTITFYDDGDGTYSYQTSKYCLFDDNALKANEPCSGEYALVNGTLIIKAEGLSSYTFKKVSPTRVEFHKGSGSSFSIISLDKKNLPPEPPANLSAINFSGTISLSWDAVVATETLLVDGTTPVTQSEGAASSYKIQSKDAADGTYTELATATTNSYTDTITSGTTRWYRVFAVNEFGTSKGSNVVSISYSE